jgi:hypothetical protein
LRSRRDQEAVNMSGSPGFILSEWLVPPVLLPIFFVLVIAASMLIQW